MTDTFRKVYRPLKQDNADLIIKIKEAAEVMESLMSAVKSREMSLAMTNLEQCTMWATKTIVLVDAQSNS